MTTDIVADASNASLEADPSEYMAVVLNRAKEWLSEAQNIAEVRETKAIAVGYESVIREKELAFDAQLSATELVRRCERRIGELVRQGQQDGTIRRPSKEVGRVSADKFGNQDVIPKPKDFFAGDADRTDSYVMADAPAEQFEQAVDQARDEGNLSRANIVRKVKGEQPKQADRSVWHSKRRHIDSNRILESLAGELDAATAGLDLMDPATIDPDVLAENVAIAKQAIATINRHLRRIQNG